MPGLGPQRTRLIEKPLKKIPSKPIFVMDHLRLRAGEQVVFQNTNWTFARGQHWALIGPNGSGKTLLAGALAGAVPSAGGEIRFGFRPSAGRAPEDSVVHVSFEQQKAVAGEDPEAMRWFSLGREEAILVRQFLSQDSIEDVNPYEVINHPLRSALSHAHRQRRILRVLRIEPLLDRVLPSLSNGEMRKILLARALLRLPRLLILDDPFNGLDTQFRAHLKHILADLMREQTLSLLLIAIRQEELPRGITHLIFVDQCRVIALGPRRAMRAHPAVRRFFQGSSRSVAGRAVPPASPRESKPRVPELVRLDGVTVEYDGRVILDGINWTIRRGESWALLGPNGAGKSTLLSLIIGDNPQAYAHAVYVFGRLRGCGESVWELKKRIGWISPELHLHFPETQTCLETILSGFHSVAGCYTRPTTKEIRIARAWLDYFDLTGQAGRPLGSLSAGLQRMTLLARALVKSPELLVLDEPCQGLDHEHCTHFVRTIDALLEQAGTTIIYVTHRSEEIPRNIRRLLYLRQGRVVRR
jgi:molybdate transport system ATP-binding protein